MVLKALDTRTNTLVAVKRDKRSIFGDQDAKDMNIEAQFLGKFSNDYIIPLLGTERDGTNVCIIMPIMQQSLDDEIFSTAYDAERTKSILEMILKGLQYIHHENIAHRDLKPGNLLVDQNGSVKISDFGGAINFTDRTKFVSYQVVGTQIYAAPETLLEIGHSFPVDIWVSKIHVFISRSRYFKNEI